MAGLSVPEQHYAKRTPFCPNNPLPVLVYRGVLPVHDEASVSEALQRHGWVKKGCWGTITTRHFHPNTHECYGIFQGSSELVFGQGGADDPEAGVKCRVQAGDVVVVPAGVAHASVSPEDHSPDPVTGEKPPRYRYIGVYPGDAPHWRNEFGKTPLRVDDDLFAEVAAVPIPSDPVHGAGGPLPEIWKAALQSS
ncbi:hypothetical protein BX600DRAFT_469651 [Xylariales sp. PMI_506]|nr:hypothetical protein BX600DRAFT_469651 [Xylariales sp. PMI_506]